MAILRRVLLLCLAVLLTGRIQGQSNFPTIVVFGDSLSDTGNIANLVENANPLRVRYPADNQLFGFNYTDGRFTDGTDTQPAAQAYLGVWIEQLAASLPAKPAVKDSLDGGTNYAYGDATTGAGTTTESDSVDGINVTVVLHNMGQQVTDYLANVASRSAAAPNAQTLYVLWGGANDLYQASAAGTDLTAATQTAINNELGLVQQLVSAGATTFMIPNLPPLGGVPSHATDPNASALNAAAAGFAQDLAQGIATLKTSLAAQGVTITVYQPDIFGLFGQFATNPMSVGLGDIADKAQGISGSPDTYLIWDGLHPTTTGHHYAAATAGNLLTPLVPSTTALSVPAAALAGQPITLTADVKSSASGSTPVGLVTFFNGAAAVGSATLNASGVGTATFTPAASTPSPYSLTAVYAGDQVSNISASAAQPVATVSSAIATTTTVTASSASVNPGASVTFAATVAPAVATYGSVTGTVTFLNGTATLGTGTLTNGVATFTTTTLPTGSLTITATYAASGIFAGSTSAAFAETVVAPGFTPTATPASLTIAAGASATTALSFTGVGGFIGPITLSCGTLPAHFSCAFSSTSLGSSPSTLTIATNVAGTGSAALARPGRPGSLRTSEVLSATLLLPGSAALLLLTLRRKRFALGGLPLSIVCLLLTAGALFGLAGCGSSNSNNAAPGTYAVPVLFTPATGSAQTVNIAVTVQ